MSEEHPSYFVNTEKVELEPIEVTISAESMDALRAQSEIRGITIDQLIDDLVTKI